jgi:hypothetical protein
MALLETKPQSKTAPADHPVFVAGDGRRARRLRHAAVVVGVLAALWIVGLGVGMLGFGSLPGVAIVKGVHNDPPAAKAPRGPLAGYDAQRSLASEVRARQQDSAPSAHARLSAPRSSSGQPAVARKAAGSTAATTPPMPTQVNPAQRTRGWARKGYSAPRGQLRTGAPPPPPATSRGRRVGQTDTTPAPPPAIPPGQVKKALEPPPPPPPPKKS